MKTVELPPDLSPQAIRMFGLMDDAFATEGIAPGQVLSVIREGMSRRPPRSDGSFVANEDLQRAMFDVWVQGYHDSFPPLCAMFAGARVPFGAYHVIDYLASSCHNVAEGFERIGRYFELVRPEVAIEIDTSGDDPIVHFLDRRRKTDMFFDEWTLGVTLRGFKETLGGAFRVLRFGVRRSDPKDGDLVRRSALLMGGPPVFGAANASMTIARSVWERVLPAGNSRLRETLERHARELLQEAASTSATTKRVRELLSGELSGGQPNIERIAKLVGVTPRTLQRRLSDEGVSFQSVLDALRAELAKRYLVAERLGVSEVSFLLGYADASAFARAHRRWFGKAPAELRRDQS